MDYAIALNDATEYDERREALMHIMRTTWKGPTKSMVGRLRDAVTAANATWPTNGDIDVESTEASNILLLHELVQQKRKRKEEEAASILQRKATRHIVVTARQELAAAQRQEDADKEARIAARKERVRIQKRIKRRAAVAAALVPPTVPQYNTEDEFANRSTESSTNTESDRQEVSHPKRKYKKRSHPDVQQSAPWTLKKRNDIANSIERLRYDMREMEVRMRIQMDAIISLNERILANQ